MFGHNRLITLYFQYQNIKANLYEHVDISGKCIALTVWISPWDVTFFSAHLSNSKKLGLAYHGGKSFYMEILY